MSSLARILLIIGGINWGLIGLGYFLDKELNFIDLFSAYYADLPAIIYCVMGAAGIWLIFKR